MSNPLSLEELAAERLIFDILADGNHLEDRACLPSNLANTLVKKLVSKACYGKAIINITKLINMIDPFLKNSLITHFDISSITLNKSLFREKSGIYSLELENMKIEAMNKLKLFIEKSCLNFSRLVLLSVETASSSVGTICDDETIRNIGKWCVNLEHLNIKGNVAVTDHGLQFLVEGCKKIKSLKLSGTSVTENGIVSALLGLPNIYYTDYEHMGTVLHNIYKVNASLALKLITLTHIPLFEYRSVYPQLTPEVTKCIKEVCPNLQHIKVEVSEDNFNCLENLAVIPNVSLYIHSFVDIRTHQPTQYFNKYGCNLTRLELEYRLVLHAKQMVFILSDCPNLVELKVMCNLFIQNEDLKYLKTLNLLQNLKLFSLKTMECQDLDSVFFVNLLKNSHNLHTFNLIMYTSDFDNVVKDVFDGIDCRSLKNIIISVPHKILRKRVGFQTLMHILQVCPALQSIANLSDWDVNIQEVANIDTSVQFIFNEED